MNVQILAVDGAFDTGLAAMLDALGTANELAPSMGPAAPRFNVQIVAVRRRVRTHNGFGVPVVAAARAGRADVVLAPALGAKTPETLDLALQRADICDAQGFLCDCAAAGAVIASACTSTFMLAASGLLDGRAATTSWWLSPAFRARFPRVQLDESRMLVDSAGIVTAGAALAHLDLALWLVRQRSPELAALTARYLVVDPRPSQAAYMIPDHLQHRDPLVERFERWARQQFPQGFSLTAAARAVGTSERTLARRLQHVLGKSPLAYFQDLRIERAVHLLETSDASVERIAEQVGYANGATLRSLLRRRIGRGTRELRGISG